MIDCLRGVWALSEFDVLREIFASIVPVAALLGFAFGTGSTLFGWMVRQPYRLFRKVAGA